MSASVGTFTRHSRTCPGCGPAASAKCLSGFALAALLLSLAMLIVLLFVPAEDGLASAGGVDAMEHQQQFRSRRVDAEETTGVQRFVLQESIGPHLSSVPAVTSASHDTPQGWRTLSFAEVADLWQTSPPFAEMFVSSIAAVPFAAMFWESAPVTRTTMDKPYEFVAVDSPVLATVTEDESTFAEYISSGEGTTNVVVFRNIGRDAQLVAPCRAGRREAGYNYAHLAAFVRSAPKEQAVNFFSTVGRSLVEEVNARLDESPVWLSTSGLGVYWLHVRLDARPKYYTYARYKTFH